MITTTTSKHQCMRALEGELAYSAARSDIECYALRVNGPLELPARFNIDRVEWDAANLQNPDETMQTITRAVEYLDWRGLLEREAGMPHIVSIRALP